jgi:hypothetical protein
MKILVGGTMLGAIGFLPTSALSPGRHGAAAQQAGEAVLSDTQRRTWRMPPLDRLPPRQMTLSTKVWMGVLRGYLLIAAALIGFKIFEAATGVAVQIPQLGGAQGGSQAPSTQSTPNPQ